MELPLQRLTNPIDVVDRIVERVPFGRVVGVDADTGDVLVEIDPRYFRPTEVEYLLGDASKAHTVLGWKHTTPFTDLVREMVEYDVELVKQDSSRQNRHD